MPPIKAPPTFAPFPLDQIEGTVAARFGRIAASMPWRPAVREPGGVHSYGELDRAAARIATRLRRRRGLNQEPIAALFEPGFAGAAAAIGILRAGKIWVPLDPGHPGDRIRAILADSGAPLVLALGDTARTLATTLAGVATIAVDPLLDGDEWPTVESDGAADHLAYLLYTSGSTGRPKGILQNHRNVLHAIRSHTNVLAISPDDRLTQLAPQSHLSGVTAMFRALLNGAMLCPWPMQARGLAHLDRWIEEQGITLYHSVPSLFRRILETMEPGDRLRSVRLVHLGGEAVLPSDVALFRARFPRSARLLHNLGSSEAGSYRQYFLGHATPVAEGPVPVGYPVDDKAVRLVDAAGNPVPPGAMGEIVVRSRYLALGYWGRPDLTDEVFRPAHDGDPRSRDYFTGDMGRMLPDGALLHLGRRDDQIKIRGQRVEPAEIERALRRLRGIADAVVVAGADPAGEPALLACLVPMDGLMPEPSAIRDALAARLPAAMIPAQIAWLSELPLLPNGKLDRRTLANAAMTPLEPAREVRLLAGGLESRLAALAADLLTASPGPDEDLFGLGLHSLAAMRLVVRIHRRIGVELPLADVFAQPTIAGLARAIAGRDKGKDGRIVPAPLPSIVADTQRHFWIQDQITPGNAAFHLAQGFRIRGPLGTPRLEAAVAALGRRHDALRFTFGGTPAPISFEIISVKAGSAEAVEADLDRRMASELNEATDLERGPLARVRLFVLGPEHHHLFLVLHHAIADGWSCGVLREELGALYEGTALEPAPRFAAYASRRQERLASRRALECREWWKHRLASLPEPPKLPGSRNGPGGPAGRVPITLPPELLTRLVALARTEGATLFSVLLAGFAALIHRYTGATDLVVGSPFANRDPAWDRAVGCFVTTLPLRIDLAGNPGFRALVRRARDAVRFGLEHQDVSVLDLPRLAGADGSRPLFSVMFAHQTLPPRTLAIPGLEIDRRPVQVRPAALDWSMVLHEGTGWLEVDAAKFDPEALGDVPAHFASLLASAADAPDRGIGNLGLCSETERRRLEAWGRGPEPGRCPVAVQEVIARRAARSPDAPAIITAAGVISCGELNHRVERLARRLVRLGIGREDLVGVLLEPSVDLIASLLAVLRSGAAYLPLHPGESADRCRRILAETHVAALITHGSTVTNPDFQGRLPVILDPELPPGPDPEIGGPLPPPDLRSLAYVIRTSGTTGGPRGVLVEHGALANYVAAAGRVFDLGPGDRMLQFASPAFDTAAEEIFTTLARGAALVVRTGRPEDDPVRFVARCRDEGLTVLDLPTAYWQTLVESIRRDRIQPPPCLRLVIIGGEAARPRDLLAWHDTEWSRIRLVNTYGPTETTIAATMAELDRDAADPSGKAPVPIGRPLPGVTVSVLDPRGEPVPPGVPGELCIAGLGLARGYLDQPERTRERFVAIPGTTGRTYRTGDRARFRPDGQLECLGRLDRQVKIRGHRVEPEAIEALLAECPGVREAVVDARTDSHSATALAAFVELEPGTRLSEARTFVRERVPESHVPAIWVSVTSWIRTPGGKIDRSSLVYPAELPPPQGVAEPQTELERVVSRAWSAELGIGSIGREDDFFELGGHSLAAVAVVARLRRELGRDVPLRTLFEAPTVAGLADRLSPNRPPSGGR